jgi:hypothetical protein
MVIATSDGAVAVDDALIVLVDELGVLAKGGNLAWWELAEAWIPELY